MSRRDELEDRLMGIVLQVFGEAEDRTRPQRFDPVELQRLGNAFRHTQRRLREWCNDYRKAVEEETTPAKPAEPKPAVNGTPPAQPVRK